jgi:hypothetical protein
MAAVDIEGDDLVVRLTPMQRLGALAGDVRVPRASIRSATVVDQPFKALRGMRIGTGIPGRLALGRWKGRGFTDFVAVHRGEPGLVVELDGGPYDRLVVSTPNARELASRLA